MFSKLRIAFRSLRKAPGFSLVVIFTLALGIGANTAIFSVVNAVLLNPAGISQPEQVIAVRVKYDKLNLKSINISPPDFADVRNSTQIFQHTAVMDGADVSYVVGGTPERLQAAMVSAQWFDVLGTKPELGRVFRPEEDQPNASGVAVLSHSSWKRLFGGDTAALGKSMELDGKLYRIIGVMGPECHLPIQTDLWLPMGLESNTFRESNRYNEWQFAIARLKPGYSLEQANAFLQVLSDRVRNNPESGRNAREGAWGLFAVPVTDFIAGNSKKPLLILLASVGFVLLIACANIAGLMLARASGRAREYAIEAALGAGRSDLVAKSMLESVLLSSAGALLGLVFAVQGTDLLLSFAPERLAGMVVPLDRYVLLFTAALFVVAALLFGFGPAWQAAWKRNFSDLQEGGRSGTVGSIRQRARSVLVVAQIALALVLLVGAGLFLRSLARLEDVSTGFNPSGVMTGAVALPENHYVKPEKRAAFLRAVTDRLRSTPGVVAAAPALPLPFSGNLSSGSFAIEEKLPSPGQPAPQADKRRIGPDYFRVLSIPLRSGRAFAEQDRIGSEPVVIIDVNLANRYWPNENPVGKHVREGATTPWSTIVGVVGHVKHESLEGDAGKGVYYSPIFQTPPTSATFAVRGQSDPVSLATAIREAVHAIDPALPVYRMVTVRNMVSASLDTRRFVVRLLGFFALAALALSVLGLFGVISYSVAQRTKEIGIRIALGAQRREVLAMVAGQGIRLVTVGVVIGFAASLALGGLISTQLYQVSPFDPVTFALTAAVIIAAALIASVLPARRAAKVDPMVALRYE